LRARRTPCRDPYAHNKTVSVQSFDPLTAEDFYTRTRQYMWEVDPAWEEDRVQQAIAAERIHLATVLGDGSGKLALDCSCGPGTQAIPLAELGWQVTGIDATPAVLAGARTRAEGMGVIADWGLGDMRQLTGLFSTGTFEVIVSCMALDNVLSDEGLLEALHGMHDVLTPTGRCYLRLRDFDHLLEVRPRYEFREERMVPFGRVIRLDDWLYENEQYVVNTWVFLREDARKGGYRWDTAAFAYRRRALRKVELKRLLDRAGFSSVSFLPQVSRWDPFELIAERTTASG
jgi:glycine/sarcosine N-methyltransferase